MSTTALIVDSTALLPPTLVTATGALVVPVTVTVDGVDYDDGVDLDADRFFELVAAPTAPTVTTAQPSPGRFLAAYDHARRSGADAAVVVVVGSAHSGTHDSARLAAANCDLDVHLVDSGQASFGVGLCALAAADALAGGADAAEAADAARNLAPRIESVFILQALELARASGRFGQTLDPVSPMASDTAVAQGAPSGPIPVLQYAGGELRVVAEVTTLDQAVEAMAEVTLAGTGRRRVASGLADPATRPVTEALEHRLEASPLVAELIRYRVGPSVAANVGPGTAGVFVHPLD